MEIGQCYISVVKMLKYFTGKNRRDLVVVQRDAGSIHQNKVGTGNIGPRERYHFGRNVHSIDRLEALHQLAGDPSRAATNFQAGFSTYALLLPLRVILSPISCSVGVELFERPRVRAVSLSTASSCNTVQRVILCPLLPLDV